MIALIKITRYFNYRIISLISPAYLHHLMDIALRSGELCRVLDFDQDYEVQVVPHIVLGSDVLLKCHIFVVEGLKCAKYNYHDRHQKDCYNLSLQAAYEAGVLDDLFLVVLLRSEIREGVDDDTEN